MKTLGILTIILITFIMECVLIPCTIGLYLLKIDEDGFFCEKLINKL